MQLYEMFNVVYSVYMYYVLRSEYRVIHQGWDFNEAHESCAQSIIVSSDPPCKNGSHRYYWKPFLIK